MGESAETKNQELIRQLESLFNGFQQSIAMFQGQTSERMRHVENQIEKIIEIQERQSAQINETYSKVTNGYEHRLRQLEEREEGLTDEFVSRREFNAAMISMRGENKLMRWLLGGLIFSIVGAIITIILT